MGHYGVRGGVVVAATQRFRLQVSVRPARPIRPAPSPEATLALSVAGSGPRLLHGTMPRHQDIIIQDVAIPKPGDTRSVGDLKTLTATTTAFRAPATAPQLLAAPLAPPLRGNVFHLH